jgi:hypothetical protein
MNSPREVEMTKMFVKNSICGYRECKKADKYVVELATRANDPQIRQLAVNMLNEYHRSVREAQDNPDNKQLRDLLVKERAQRERDKRIAEEAGSGAKVVAEKIIPEPESIIEGKRARRQVQRFADLIWNDSGKQVGVAPKNVLGDLLSDFELSSDEEGLQSHKATFSESEADSDFHGSEHDSVAGSNPDDVHERPLTAKQLAKQAAREARHSIPTMDEATRQLAEKLLEDYDRQYTDDDLNKDEHMVRALKLIYCRKAGLPYDNVPTPHIQVCTSPEKFF